MSLKTLSFDPGEKNFAYSILEHKSRKGKVISRSIKNGILKKPVKHLNDEELFGRESASFHNEIKELLSNNIDIVSIERFMGRGIRVGTMSESVNIMIGIIIVKTKNVLNVLPNLIHPATWKNAYNRTVVGDLNGCYQICRTSNHQLDASLLGIYSASNYYDIIPFSSISSEIKRDKFLSSIEQASQTKLIQRRKKRNNFIG